MRSRRLRRDGASGFLLATGGVLLVAAALVLDARKSGSWGHGGRFADLGLTCALLFALGFAGLRQRTRGEPLSSAESWRGVLLVEALLLLPLSLGQLLDWAGGTAGAALNVAWIFALTAVVGALLSFVAYVRYALLLSTLSLLVAWLSTWNKVLDHPSATTFRGLLVAIAAIFFCAALVLAARGFRHASELVTGGAIAAVAAGGFGVVDGLINLVARGVSGAPGGSGGSAAVFGSLHLPKQHVPWDLLLLVVSIAVIWHGSRAGARGPAYVGALGLGLFSLSVGTELARSAAGQEPTHSVVGWPLVLLIATGVCLVAGLLMWRAASAPGPAPPAPPAAD